MKNKIPFLFWTAVGFLLLAGTIRSQTNPQTGVATDRLVSTTRTLNTAEVMYFQKDKHFANTNEMLGFLRDRDLLKRLPVELSDPHVTQLEITTTSDGLHYQLGIKQPTDSSANNARCQPAAFSDDSGVIYLGTPLGCNGAGQ